MERELQRWLDHARRQGLMDGFRRRREAEQAAAVARNAEIRALAIERRAIVAGERKPLWQRWLTAMF